MLHEMLAGAHPVPLELLDPHHDDILGDADIREREVDRHGLLPPRARAIGHDEEVDVTLGGGGASRELFRGHFHFQPNGEQSFDVFPDNRRFLMIQPVPESRRELA